MSFPLKKLITNWYNREHSPFVLIGLCGLFIMLLDNQRFYSNLSTSLSQSSQTSIEITLSVTLISIGFLGILLSLFAFRHLLKPVLVIILIVSATTAYFMDTYNIVIDDGMLLNIAQTDSQEALELFSWNLLAYIILLGIFPALFVMKTKLRFPTFARHSLHQITAFIISLLVITIGVGAFYKDLSLFGREHKDLRYYLNPGYPIYSLVKFSKNIVPPTQASITPIGLDAKPKQVTLNQAAAKKTLLVFVVGETARAANFSYGGYERDTNRFTRDQEILYFNNVRSCGTATAESLPCMFSLLEHRNFSTQNAKAQENLLDVLQRAGINTVWFDNNSGCKGVCNRIEHLNLANQTDPRFCGNGECLDEILVASLSQSIRKINGDSVIVLHQKGSHGPSYAKRYPKQSTYFSPACLKDQVQECSQEEIINAYDNTIAYTDYVLNRIIELLKQHSDKLNTAMLYVSDHGESLGENGLYLHGLPYAIAPDTQTHVPMMLWLSTGYKEKLALNASCLTQRLSTPYSHDNLFHSILGMMDIDTRSYSAEKDITNACRNTQGISRL